MNSPLETSIAFFEMKRRFFVRQLSVFLLISVSLGIANDMCILKFYRDREPYCPCRRNAMFTNLPQEMLTYQKDTTYLCICRLRNIQCFRGKILSMWNARYAFWEKRNSKKYIYNCFQGTIQIHLREIYLNWRKVYTKLLIIFFFI